MDDGNASATSEGSLSSSTSSDTAEPTSELCELEKGLVKLLPVEVRSHVLFLLEARDKDVSRLEKRLELAQDAAAAAEEKAAMMGRKEVHEIVSELIRVREENEALRVAQAEAGVMQALASLLVSRNAEIRRLQAVKGECPASSTRVREMEITVKKLQKENSALREECTKQRVELMDAKGELAMSLEEVAELRDECARLVQEQSKLLGCSSSPPPASYVLEERATVAERKVALQNAEIARLTDELADVKRELRDTHEQVRLLRQSNKELNEEANSLSRENTALATAVCSREAELARGQMEGLKHDAMLSTLQLGEMELPRLDTPGVADEGHWVLHL